MKSKAPAALGNIALFIAIAGGILSAWLTLHTGRNNPSTLLVTAFLLWVLSPFVAFVFTVFQSKQWTEKRKRSFYLLVFLVTIISILFYSRLLVISTKTAFVFLVVPFFSWILLALVLFFTRTYRKSI